MASIPSGLTTRTDSSAANEPVSLPGVTAKATRVSTGAPMASHRAGRHRRDGMCPSGNSRKIGMKMASTATIDHRSNHAESRPNGNEPGWVASAYVA